jgi:hypothetical protein
VDLGKGADFVNPSQGLQPAADRAKQDVHPEPEEEPQLTRGRGAVDQSGVLITGQTTLMEIESRTGVSARLIAEKLRLPSQVPLDMPLGKLRKVHRFTMQDLRSIVSDQLKNTELRPSPPR